MGCGKYGRTFFVVLEGACGRDKGELGVKNEENNAPCLEDVGVGERAVDSSVSSVQPLWLCLCAVAGRIRFGWLGVLYSWVVPAVSPNRVQSDGDRRALPTRGAPD